jgi:hypothetical protein
MREETLITTFNTWVNHNTKIFSAVKYLMREAAN